MQNVSCKNDNSAYLHFLIMSFDPDFYFISGLYLSSPLKYFNDALSDYTTGQHRVSYARRRSLLFSLPEHEVLMVSYCYQSLSVVRALSTFCFKRLLLQNGLMDFEIISQKSSLDDPLPKLLKPFCSVGQDCRQS